MKGITLTRTGAKKRRGEEGLASARALTDSVVLAGLVLTSAP